MHLEEFPENEMELVYDEEAISIFFLISIFAMKLANWFMMRKLSLYFVSLAY